MSCLGFLRRCLPSALAATLVTAAFAVPLGTLPPAQAFPQCTIRGTSAGEKLVGTPTRDVICGLGGNDILYGYGGNDALIDGAGADQSVGGAGDDFFYGSGGADVFSGGDGADELRGGVGNDTLRGGAGTDVLSGEDGADLSEGGGGDDRTYGDAGRDRMSGGTGRDTVDYRLVNDAVVVDLDGVADDGVPGENDLVAADFENITGTGRDDVLTGDSGANTLVGEYGKDRLVGGAGDDRLLGRGWRDALYGGDGDDVLRGEGDNDVLQGAAGVDSLDGGTTDNSQGNACDDDPADVSVVSCRRDSTGPAIVGVSTTDGEIAVTPGTTFQVSMDVEDVAGTEEAGVTVTLDGEPVALCPGRSRLRSGDPEAFYSFWTVTCKVPADAALGGYVITPWARDLLGHGTNTEPADVPLKDASIAVVSGAADTDVPAVTALSVSDTALTPGEQFTVTADMADPSGVRSTGTVVSLDRPQQQRWCGDFGGTRVVGTSVTDGTWTFSCRVPDLVRNGAYTISTWGSDSVGNQDSSAPAPTTTVQVTGGSDDATPLEVTSVSVSDPSLVPGQAFTVRAQLRDESGVQTAWALPTLNGRQTYEMCGTHNGVLVAGTRTDGTWKFTCSVPQQVLNGTYALTAEGVDALGNMGTTGAASTTFEVTGGNDGSGPDILSVTATLGSVAPGEPVTITAQVRDEVDVMGVGWFLYGPNGSSLNLCPETQPSLTSGTRTDGLWAETCTIPADTAPGVYEIKPYASNRLGSWTTETRNVGSVYTTATLTIR